MSFGDYLKAELKTAWLFLAVFIAIGVALDLLLYQRPVDWPGRLSVAVFATVVFVVLSAWQKKRKAE